MKEARTVVEYNPIYRTIYIADDGVPFDTKEECEEYEKNAVQICKFRVANLGGLRPIDFEGLTSDCNEYAWYHPTSKEEVIALEKYYRLQPGRIYTPQLVCIEYTPYGTGIYGSAYTESELKSDSEEFWEKLGYKITFTPADETEEDDIKKGE